MAVSLCTDSRLDDPLSNHSWERRNSIQYQKNIIPVCHHLEEDMLYFPLEVIRTFFGQHTYDVVTSAEYWCNEHMRRCNDTSIFADLCTTSRGATIRSIPTLHTWDHSSSLSIQQVSSTEKVLNTYQQCWRCTTTLKSGSKPIG